MKTKKLLTILSFLVFALGVVVLLCLGINRFLWTKMVEKNEAIHFTPEMIVDALQKSSLEITEVEYNYLPPDYQTAEYGARVFIPSTQYAFTYKVCIIKTSSWEEARLSTKCGNNHTCGAIEQYSFYLGDIFIEVYPDDKEMGEELKKIIESALIDTKN